jgi:hypothetical protein
MDSRVLRAYCADDGIPSLMEAFRTALKSSDIHLYLYMASKATTNVGAGKEWEP